MDTAEVVGQQSSQLLGVPVKCSSAFDGGHCYEVGSPVFQKGREVGLRIRTPYGHRVVASLFFGSYGTKLLDVWKSMSDEVLEDALRYLWLFQDRLTIKLRVCDVDISEMGAFANALRSTKTPADFGLSVSADCDRVHAVDQVTLIVQCAFGFLLMLSGVLADDKNEEETGGVIEGQKHTYSTTRYERSPKNRALCIAANGVRCAACGFDFGAKYGAFAANFIEVHHITPVSQLDHPTALDPTRDLVPLCPNCHAVVHMANPPLTIDELKSRIESGVDQ